MIIKLQHDFECIIDDEDFDLIKDYKWRAVKMRNSNIYYAYASVYRKGKTPLTLQMHRVIMHFPDYDIDHKNRSGLDNRKENLRLCTESQNAFNQTIRASNKTEYKGVSISRNKFRAIVTVNYKNIHLGYFNSALEASEAYKAKAKELHGEFYRET